MKVKLEGVEQQEKLVVVNKKRSVDNATN